MKKRALTVLAVLVAAIASVVALSTPASAAPNGNKICGAAFKHVETIKFGPDKGKKLELMWKRAKDGSNVWCAYAYRPTSGRIEVYLLDNGGDGYHDSKVGHLAGPGKVRGPRCMFAIAETAAGAYVRTQTWCFSLA